MYTSLISDQHPLHTLDVAIIFSKCLASWHAARPMSSCQNNPSPSDPIDSVSRHFPPPSLSKSVSLLRNEMWRVRWTLSTATRLHRIRWSPLADISTSSSTQTCCKFSKTIANWQAASPMDSWHGNPSPSAPMGSVCRHSPPLWLLYFAVYFLSLSRTNTRRVRYTLATAARLHRIWWSLAVCLHVFPPSPRLYTLLYI